MKKYILFSMLLMILSCSKTKKEDIQQKLQKEEISNEEFIKTKVETYRDTIKIDYKKHQQLLEILTVLPDSSMGSWDWKKDERIDFVKFIKENNYTIDTTEHFLNIKLITPNSFKMQIVDGTWEMNVFHVSSNNSIILTNDIVGDGGTIYIYENIKEKLKQINYNNFFGNFTLELLKSESEECLEDIEDYDFGYNFNRINQEELKVKNIMLFKDENNDCFMGNTISLKFNKSTKRFDYHKIYWEN